nr:Siderophore biosynthesis non-ribosomal peptide synthetase modules [Kibdelosporangium sp. MJ126-NF4]
MTGDGFVADTSFAQQSMWLLHQIDPGRPTYNVIAAARVCGALQAVALQRALDAVVDRHESLRTVFRIEDEKPVQVILPSPRVPLPVSAVHPSEIDAAVQREVETPLDLEHGPLLRMRLLRISADDHVLVLVMHHIVTDGWSSAIVFRELSHYYQAFAHGAAAELPELPIQYADFALWQRETLDGPKLDGLVDYWRRQLDGAEALRLPADRARPAVRSSRGATLRFDIPGTLMTAVGELGRRRRATPFMVLLAVVQALFSRESGQLDITVSTAVANRDRPEITGLIGYFVNTLPLRTDLSGNPTVLELIDRAAMTCRDAYDHQEMPFDKIVEVVQPERDGGIGNALVRAMLVLQNMPTEPWKSGELLFEPMRLDNRTALLDLSIIVEATAAEDYLCSIEYSVDLFDHATITRFGEALVQMLEAFVADPDARIEHIELAAETAWARLVGRWNATSREMPGDLVHELVTEQATRTPSAIALEHGDTRLTYAELEDRAERLARVLRSCSVGEESVVALALPPSIELATAVLAVLKAGGAFLPLDIHLPPARVAEVVSDSGTRLVLTQSTLEPALAGAFTGCRVVNLDLEWPATRVADVTDAPRRGPSASGLACVFYTSGSTNRPKGVMFVHGALANFTVAVAEDFRLTPADRYLQLSSVGFDVVLEELLPTLVAGATVVLPTERLLATGGDLTACVEQRRITVVDLTPAYWHEWVRQLAERGGAPETLRLAVVGGDRVLAECVDIWRRFGVELVEVYGLTEATVTSTTCHAREGVRGPGPAAVIGSPLPNTTAHVLDHRLRPVPAGAVGEVYLGGKGLARGYLGRPAETAFRFVADPFGAPGGRLCRTGDLARRRPDGEIEFLGRADNQLKIRGHRVEPGEIEAVLARHPAVGQAAVVALADSGGKRLAAYVTLAGSPAPEPGELREFVAERLPEFMVPAAVVALESMPMTPNGKLDRKALLAPDFAALSTSRAPRTPREEQVCALMAQVLGVERVGAEDDFFSVGGDSIRVIQLSSRAMAAGLTVTPRDVFARRTAARLALIADQPGHAAAEEPGAAVGKVAPTPAVARLAGLGGTMDGFAKAVLLRVPPDLGEGVLVDATRALLDRHDVLRMKVEAGEGDAWELDIPPRGTVAAEQLVSRLDVRGLDESQRRAVAARQAAAARKELNPRTGQMCRMVWLDAGAEPSGLLVVLHHLVVDGVSWRILLADLASACQAVAQGRQVTLAPVPTSFRRWAAGLATAALEPERVGELEFWRNTLSTPDPLLGTRALDVAHDVAAHAGTVRMELAPAVAGPLLTEVPAAFRADAQDVLLTGLALAVGRWRGQGTEVLVDIEAPGREERTVPGADLSRTVGCFTSTHPVALDPGTVRLADAVKLVKEQVRAAPGDGIGYGLLRYLNPETAGVLADAAVPQIGFTYLGRFGPDEVGGWTVDQGTASLDEGFDPGTPLSHVLEIEAVAVELPTGLTLSARLSWASGALPDQSVRALGEHWFAALGELAALAGDPGNGGLTPSDLPLLSLSQVEIDELAEEWEEDHEGST